MTIVGTNFTKINVEKKKAVKGKVQINNSVSIKDVKQANLVLGASKQSGIRFEFEFTAKYDPDFSEIFIAGDVLFLTKEEDAKKILADWDKDKQIDKVLMSTIVNNILNKCQIQALILSQTMGLPSPINLPKFKAQNN